MSNPTRESVLGTLVHRAVFMPFAKPQALTRSKESIVFRNGESESISDAICASANLIGIACRESLDSYNENQRWRALLELIVDAGGPWWSLSATQYRGLEEKDREWILTRLGKIALRVGEWMEKTARDEDWKWIWSEVPLWSWTVSTPETTRIDLLVGAGIRGARGYAFDLKVTKENYLADDFQPSEDHLDSLRRYRAGLDRTTFPGAGRASLALLYADRDGKRDCDAIKRRVPRW